jgi:hypothetical protein
MRSSTDVERRWQRAELTAFAVACAGVLLWYYLSGERAFWDFRSYYAAAMALQQGLDPYGVESLSRASGLQIELPRSLHSTSLWRPT